MSEQLHITNSDSEWVPKHYATLVGLAAGMYMITLALVPKIIEIYGFAVPVSIITFPICCILTDILTEVYGFNRARRSVWITLVCTLLFAIFTQIAIAIPPAPFWQDQESFQKIFATSWRIVIAGCSAWVVGEFINSYVMTKMKIFQNAKGMSLRFIGSTVVGQFFDTLVFFSIAFIGMFSSSQLINMMFTAWAMKVGYEIIALPLSTNVTKYIKRLEGIEHFDRQKISVI
jgi:uncharacterized integral membrane protein (TIGR00697 family)